MGHGSQAELINSDPTARILRWFRFLWTRNRLILFGGTFLLTILRLLMTSSLAIQLLGSNYDDVLSIKLSRELPHHWLGAYSKMTLIKGPGYPLWLAGVSSLHIHLLLAQQLFYALACVVLVLALRPIIRFPILLLAVYAVILMNPVTVGPDSCLLFREDIYNSECVLLAGALLGVVTRSHARFWIRWLWGIACGLALAAALITREEGVWLAPLMAAMLIPAAIVFFRRRKRLPLLSWLITPALPLVVALCGVMTICTFNYVNYGEFLVTEMLHSPFVAAIGAMQRVYPPHPHLMVPVTRETRMEIYAVSPAFARLEPNMEGNEGRGWQHVSEQSCPELIGLNEIGGGWYIWAVRECVDKLGLYSSAAAANAYYQQVADEINAGVDNGKLKGGSYRDTLAPPWRREYLPLILQRAPILLSRLVNMTYQAPDPRRQSRSWAPAAIIDDLRQHTQWPIWSSDPDKIAPSAATLAADRRFISLQVLYRWYVRWMEPFAIASAVALPSLLAIPSYRREYAWALLFLFGLAASIIVHSAIFLFVDVSSFPAIHQGRYLGVGQTFLLVAVSVCLATLASGLCRLARIRMRRGTIA
jgi:hypothetical protein